MNEEHDIFAFPQEILDAIIDQVGIEAHESENFDTLRKCALVSRSLLPSSRKWLWEDLSFTLATFEPGQGELLASLCCFPMEVHKYIKKLFLYYYDYSDLGENYSRYRLYHVLGYFSNLQELSVKFRQDPACQKTKLEKLNHKSQSLDLFLLSKLTTLSLINVSNVPISVFQILPQTLKWMTLKSISICNDMGKRIATLREQLKRNRKDFVYLEYLEIATTQYHAPGVWDSVFSPSTFECFPIDLSCLREVRLVHHSSEGLVKAWDTLRTCATTIEKLSFQDQNCTSSLFSPFQLGKFTRLECLVIEFDFWDFDELVAFFSGHGPEVNRHITQIVLKLTEVLLFGEDPMDFIDGSKDKWDALIDVFDRQYASVRSIIVQLLDCDWTTESHFSDSDPEITFPQSPPAIRRPRFRDPATIEAIVCDSIVRQFKERLASKGVEIKCYRPISGI